MGIDQLQGEQMILRDYEVLSICMMHRGGTGQDPSINTFRGQDCNDCPSVRTCPLMPITEETSVELNAQVACSILLEQNLPN